jgi:hypothetical protein
VAERNRTEDDRARTFASEAEAGSQGFLREVFGFVRYRKAWWLVPILVALLAYGILLTAGGSVVAPFIYTLF